MDPLANENVPLLTDDEIKALTQFAFRPHRCLVEILPNRQMRFQVIKRKPRRLIYTEPGIPIEALREASELLELLHWVRRVLEKRGYELMTHNQNALATIPGEYIARAAMTLPDAASAPDEPHYVKIPLRRRWYRLTFKRFKHKRGKTTRWFWTAEHAEEIA